MVVFLCLIYIVSFVYCWDNNDKRAGIFQQGGNISSSSKYVHGIDSLIPWSKVEIADNVWNFSSIDELFKANVAIHSNISIIVKPETGNTAPLWLYDPPINVPVVYLNTTNSQGPGPWPYYLDPTYQIYFKRYILKIYNYLINNEYFPKNIFVTQAEFGTTGDDGPWHGTPINASYDISSQQWWNYTQYMSLYIYNIYYNSTPNTSPDLLLLFNHGSDVTKNDWVTENCPSSYRKSGQASHAYQLNNEYINYVNIGYLSRNITQNGIELRIRGEVQTNQNKSKGWWAEAPYWNCFTLLQWHLTFGIDFPGLDGDFITNGSYDIQMAFFNEFAGYKYPNVSKGAFIALRDGLDSNDTKRFPESIFGPNTIDNQNRMVKIAQNMSEYGAKQEDPASGCGGQGNQRKATGLNDVGFGIYSSNYGRFLYQINPQNTSQGRWRVGSMTDPSQIYGRFARSFDYKSSKMYMCFVFNKELWGGLPLKNAINLEFIIAYFDKGNGKWQFEYDSQNSSNQIAFSVETTNTNKWITKTFNINDAYFGQRGYMNSDFCLHSMDENDDI
eukprot:143951_1